MKRRVNALLALAVVAACGEAPTEPTADLVVAPSFSLTQATTVITFDDPDGVYVPGDVTEKGFRVWTTDSFLFGIVSWYGNDGPDREINLGNNGKTIQVAAVDGSPFTMLSFFASSLQPSTAGITVRAFDAANVQVASIHINDGYPGGQYALPAAFADVARVTFQSSGGGSQGNHSLDDLTILAGPGNPETKDDCKDGGWEKYGFKNQGLCIQYVNTGKDSR